MKTITVRFGERSAASRYATVVTVLDSHIAEFESHGLTQRWGLGYIPKGGEGRQVFQGLMVPGPWPFAFGLSTCITANPEHGTQAESERMKAAGTEIVASEGDLVDFGDGLLWPIIRTGWSKKYLGFGEPTEVKQEVAR